MRKSVQNAFALPTQLPATPPILISGVSMALSPPPRALLFDVFGTCVEWRNTVTNELHSQAHAALNSATASLASTVRLKASEMTIENWGLFAEQWRNTYKKFTRALAADPVKPWKSVDEHHLDSLKELLAEWGIDGLWTDEEVRAMSLIWHKLDAWDDSATGVAHLNKLFHTCTLSNGNLSLLADLRVHSNIPFTHIFSAEDFGSYKPSPKVYLGAAEKLRLPPNQCAMVAAHLHDLKAAKSCGLQTIYVERLGEEEWNSQQIESAKKEGWVDLWVSMEAGTRGFITVAEQLGIDTSRDSPKRLSSSAPVGGT